MFNTIKRSDEISQLFNKGKMISFRHFSIFYVDSTESQIAFIAGKKLGNSVKRNYLRRKLKRVYLENQDWFLNKKAIIVAKYKLLTASDDDVKSDFRRVLKRSFENSDKKDSFIAD